MSKRIWYSESTVSSNLHIIEFNLFKSINMDQLTIK